MGIKYAVNENFFKKWSQEMAYTLGYLYADGSLEDASYIRGKYVRVSSVERENIVKIREWLGSEHTITPKAPTSTNGKVGYLLRIGNHILYDDLTRLGLYPNKSLTITFPAIPKKYLRHFIRGYFDGDGCIQLSMAKGVLQKLNAVFTSGSRDFLQELALQIHNVADTKQMKVYNSHRSCVLSYATSDSVKLFKLMYRYAKKSVYLERKFDVYKKFFMMKPKRVDKKVKNILQYMG